MIMIGMKYKLQEQLRYSSKATWHMWIEHMQLIGWKYAVLSIHIGMCRKKILPKLIFERQECGLRRYYVGIHMGTYRFNSAFMYIHI